jgi:hypothetical protein
MLTVREDTIFGFKMEEVFGKGRNLHNVRLYDVLANDNSVYKIKKSE